MARRLIIAAALCVVGAAATRVGAARADGRAVARGEKVYMTYCHLCHGDRGDGTGHIGNGLNTRPVDFTAPQNASHLTEDFVYRLVRDGSAAQGRSLFMISWRGILKDDEIRDVAAYTLSLAAAAREQPGNGVQLRK